MADIKLNQAAIDALVTDPGVTEDMMRRGEQVAAAARSDAPVLTGAYRDSITVTEREGGGVDVGSDLPYALVVQARTGNLARALDAAGGE